MPVRLELTKEDYSSIDNIPSTLASSVPSYSLGVPSCGGIPLSVPSVQGPPFKSSTSTSQHLTQLAYTSEHPQTQLLDSDPITDNSVHNQVSNVQEPASSACCISGDTALNSPNIDSSLINKPDSVVTQSKIGFKNRTSSIVHNSISQTLRPQSNLSDPHLYSRNLSLSRALAVTLTAVVTPLSIAVIKLPVPISNKRQTTEILKSVTDLNINSEYLIESKSSGNNSVNKYNFTDSKASVVLSTEEFGTFATDNKLINFTSTRSISPTLQSSLPTQELHQLTSVNYTLPSAAAVTLPTIIEAPEFPVTPEHGCSVTAAALLRIPEILLIPPTPLKQLIAQQLTPFCYRGEKEIILESPKPSTSSYRPLTPNLEILSTPFQYHQPPPSSPLSNSPSQSPSPPSLSTSTTIPHLYTEDSISATLTTLVDDPSIICAAPLQPIDLIINASSIVETSLSVKKSPSFRNICQVQQSELQDREPRRQSKCHRRFCCSAKRPNC